MTNDDLRERVVVVTGGGSGIGKATIELAAKAGAKVVAFGRNREKLEAITGIPEASLLRVTGDVTQRRDLDELFRATRQRFGRIDALVANAGIVRIAPFAETTEALFDETMATNLRGTYFTVQAALPLMRSQPAGAIVTVSSVAGLRGVPGAIAYATAKGAVLQLTRCLARDLAQDNIRVNCVAPGVIRTRFHADMTPDRRKINLEQRIPLRAEGTPQQVADAVMLLVTNDYITGEVVVVDGGLSMRVA